MYTAEQIANIGLSKIGQTRVKRLDPPTSPLELFISANYTHWKRLELTKHKWVFAREVNYVLTLSDTLANVEQPYKYLLPTECLKPIRTRRTEWRQAGKYLYSCNSTLSIDFILDCPEADFDETFVEVLAAKIAVESAEYITQSNTKKADAKTLYDEAVSDAKSQNAFIVGPQDDAVDDYSFPFLSGRFANNA